MWTYHTALGGARIIVDPITQEYLAYFGETYLGKWSTPTFAAHQVHHYLFKLAGLDIPIHLHEWECPDQEARRNLSD